MRICVQSRASTKEVTQSRCLATYQTRLASAAQHRRVHPSSLRRHAVVAGDRPHRHKTRGTCPKTMPIVVFHVRGAARYMHRALLVYGTRTRRVCARRAVSTRRRAQEAGHGRTVFAPSTRSSSPCAPSRLHWPSRRRALHLSGRGRVRVPARTRACPRPSHTVHRAKSNPDGPNVDEIRRRRSTSYLWYIAAPVRRGMPFEHALDVEHPSAVQVRKGRRRGRCRSRTENGRGQRHRVMMPCHRTNGGGDRPGRRVRIRVQGRVLWEDVSGCVRV